MKIINGSTRTVILTKKYAIKIPYIGKYKNFLYGLLANKSEVRFNKLKDNRLCPVIFYVPFGLTVVMPRCVEISLQDFEAVIKSDFRLKPFPIPVESKSDSFGYYNNKTVAVDYGC